MRVRIAGFDLAKCLKNDECQVRQRFYVENVVFAPEIMAGIEHDAVVDVWGLGRVALELLALTSRS